MLRKRAVFAVLFFVFSADVITMASAQDNSAFGYEGITSSRTVPEQVLVTSNSGPNFQSNSSNTASVSTSTPISTSTPTSASASAPSTSDTLARSTNTTNSPMSPSLGLVSNTTSESLIPRVIPRFEPLSRYGNPASYMVSGKIYTLRSEKEPYHETGIASWYGPGFHRLRTSSGETYDMHSMTAAHKTLPIPCYVKVKNLQNGKEITVRVNDRGPFHEGRIIDLSYAAAKELGVVGSGTAMVDVSSVEIPAEGTNTSTSNNAPNNGAYNNLNPSENIQQTSSMSSSSSYNTPPPRAALSHENQFYLQLAVFSQPQFAEKLRQTLQPRVPEPINVEPKHIGDKLFYAVILGPVTNHDRADTLSGKLVAIGYNKPMVFMN